MRILGHDKMILYLATAQASIFNTPRQAFFFIKSAHEAFFCVIPKFFQQTFLATFYLIFLHLSIQTLALEIHNFKPIRYTYLRHN